MEIEEQEKRSRDIADSIRRYLIAINTGGIGVTFGVAGSLASQKVNPGWVVWPIAIFSIGLVIVGGSLFLAKHKALKRRDAKIKNETEPDYTHLLWRNFTWDFLALFIFLFGVLGIFGVRVKTTFAIDMLNTSFYSDPKYT